MLEAYQLKEAAAASAELVGGGNQTAYPAAFYPLACSGGPDVRAAVAAGRIPPGWDSRPFSVSGAGGDRPRRIYVNHVGKTSSWMRPAFDAHDLRASLWLQVGSSPRVG